MSLDTFLSTLQLGLVYSVLALGLFLSFRILDTPDLTVDGSFVTGMAISAVLTLAGHPILGLAAAFAGGLSAGLVTGLLHTRLKIQPILDGILTMTALYSVNLRIMAGKPNLSLYKKETLFSLFEGSVPQATTVLLLLTVAGLVILLTVFLKTQLGLSLRATGDNEEMVREAINRELARKGQVYYVYNRVTDIDEVAAKIQKLVPDAVVTFAHGQMHEHQLERIMTDFINGEIDVLVSTTIIETGLDIPNANTMIIHDADRLGLSQLYQLRGRVGRSNRTSFAFLMYKRDKLLKEEAEKRLQAIREFTELGSGIKIAMRDLEIRGAGNVLGAEQHGHMEAVGYDLYCKMLNQAVLALKGEETEEESYATSVECDIDAYIPAAYIKNEYQKLDIYKRISAIETEDEYMDMQDELLDRFGDIPKSVENLLVIARVRALAHKCYVTEVLVKEKEVKLTMYQKAKINVGGIPDLVNSYGGALKLVPGEVPVFHYVERKPKGITIEDMLFKAEEILKGLRKLRM